MNPCMQAEAHRDDLRPPPLLCVSTMMYSA